MKFRMRTMNGLYEQLNHLLPIPANEWEFFLTLTTVRHISKNEHFIQAGEHTDRIGICVKGLFRLYYTTPDGVEYNKNFCAKNDFITSYSAMLQRVPSFLSIQAMTESELIVFCYRDLLALYDRHVCWEKLGRLLAEKLFIQKETRERELLMLSAEERYRLFLERFGRQAEQIPQYHIASYLGITPVALSRIRRRLT